MNDNLKGVLLASATALLWGFLPLFLKYALQFSDSYTIVWFRFLSAFMILTFYFGIRNPTCFRVAKKPSALLFAAAFGLGLNYLGYMKGVDLTGPENAQILIQIAPLLFSVIGIFYFKEKLTLLQMGGYAVALLGFLFFYRDLLSGVSDGVQVFKRGSLWILFAAMTWAGYAAFNKVLLRRWQSQQINWVIYGFCALFFLPFANFNQVLSWDIWQWFIMVLLGVNTLLAYGAFAEAVRWIPAPKVSIIITLNPIITLVLMRVVEDLNLSWVTVRQISLFGYFGAFLVIVGAFLVAKQKKT